jgi:hypothetical protein
LERVQSIPLDELQPFQDHPFKVQNNEELERMIESIRKVGAITPALARPLPDGGYEVISGHRRLEACRQAVPPPPLGAVVSKCALLSSGFRPFFQNVHDSALHIKFCHAASAVKTIDSSAIMRFTSSS